MHHDICEDIYDTCLDAHILLEVLLVQKERWVAAQVESQQTPEWTVVYNLDVAVHSRGR